MQTMSSQESYVFHVGFYLYPLCTSTMMKHSRSFVGLVKVTCEYEHKASVVETKRP